MKRIILFCLLSSIWATLLSQKQTFDLTNFTAPAKKDARLPDGQGWKKETKENLISYTATNSKKNTWCQIGIYKSTTSKGSIEQDFESEWQLLIAAPYKITDAPQVNEVQEADGWKIKAGAGKFMFNTITSSAMLTTMSGYNRCVSIVAITNSSTYLPAIENFLASVEMKKPETLSAGQAENPQQPSVINPDNPAIIGTWGKNAGVNPAYADPVATGNAGYSKDQYTFNANGTYSFVSKTFRYSSDKLLLVKESGSYQLSGNNLTLNPQKSVIEAWSKKDGSDKWGKLLSTQNRPLEKITYTFTKHYFSGIQEWNLVLQASTPTQRDGPFSRNDTYSNAWYYRPIASTNPVIELPDGQ